MALSPRRFKGCTCFNVAELTVSGDRGMCAAHVSSQTRCTDTPESIALATERVSVDSSRIHLYPSINGHGHGERPMSQVLTAREIMVAQMVSQGLPNKKIATQLAISVGTTKTHLHHIYQKLNCAGRLGLAIHMQKNGWL